MNTKAGIKVVGEAMGLYGHPVKHFKSVEESSYKSGDKPQNVGFYYDSQLEDPFLSISLHPNTYQTENGGWEVYTKENSLSPTIGSDYDRYSKIPLARCLMTEDFRYSITNNFTDNDGGNPIEGIFNSFKPYAPILGKLGAGIESGIKETNGDTMGSYMVSKANQFGNWLFPLLKKGSKLLNTGMIVQGSRFTYYSGTSFNLNNLELKFTVFSDWVPKYGYDSEGKYVALDYVFQPVTDYIKNISPYVMGKYYPADKENMNRLFGEAALKEAKEKGENEKTISDKFKELIGEYVGFQAPPAGFEMDTKNLNNVLKGTLRLNIGGMYAINNLIIKNMDVTLSRVQSKSPSYTTVNREEKNLSGILVPLYAEITLQLAPACSIIDTSFVKIIDGSGVNSDILNPMTKKYLDELDAKLKAMTKDNWLWKSSMKNNLKKQMAKELQQDNKNQKNETISDEDLKKLYEPNHWEKGVNLQNKYEQQGLET